jgi:hypothetical protein
VAQVEEAYKKLSDLDRITLQINRFKSEVDSGSRTSFIGFENLQSRCETAVLKVKRASLIFKKQKPRTYQRVKTQTKLAKKRCLAVAGEAEKSTN